MIHKRSIVLSKRKRRIIEIKPKANKLIKKSVKKLTQNKQR